MKRWSAALAASALLLAGCTDSTDEPGPAATPAPSPTPSATATPSATPPPAGTAAGVSAPVEDRVYPDVGDPGVDALRYDLDLTWDPQARVLDGRETLRLRATGDADHLQLDLGPVLTVAGVTVNGRKAAFEHQGKDLVVNTDVRKDRRYTLVIRYSGTPQPVEAPTERADIDSLGWTTTADGEVWTMQEPFGAYSWYAVNDQPSDKARYAFTISAPAPWVGVANGELRSRTTRSGRTVTRWVLDEPAASYLVTVAIGDLVSTKDTADSGVPITYWTPRDRPALLDRIDSAPTALAWLEEHLGPYPFDRLGIVVVESRSAMETQTMITLGDTEYATSPAVVMHEMAHHWYGDQVTPVDWRDMWMNEGMATWLQAAWTAEVEAVPLEAIMGGYAETEADLRATYGPPANYDPNTFGAGNVYTIPALMWDEVRQLLGDDEFWRLVREWPAAHDNQNADYDDITAWWSEQSGEDLQPLFDAWLLGETSPVESS